VARRPFALHVHALPEGASSTSRLQLVAARMGYGAVAVGNHHDAPLPEGAVLPITRLYRAVEARTETASGLSRLVPQLREGFDLLAVHGGNPSVLRAAAQDGRVDLVCHPHLARGNANHVLARLAARHGVALEFCYSPLVHLRGGERERALRYLASLLSLQRRYGFPYVVAAGAWSHYDLRAPRDVEALCAAFGMEPDEVQAGMEEHPRMLVERRTDARRLDEGVYLCG